MNKQSFPGSTRVLSLPLALLALFVLSACGSGAETQLNPVTVRPPVLDYTGPAPQTADVQSFKINLWDNIRSTDRCGSCHVENGQAPSFARLDDVNLAYADANGIVDLPTPQNSLMVTKVAGGHNCWLTSDAACAEILTTWITNWAGDLANSSGRQIVLEAPPIKVPGASRNYPADSSLFSSTVYPVLTQYCAGCHSSGSQTQQSPYFADANVDTAYDAVKTKLNLDDPANSRLVVRLRDEFHNCWDDCAANATTMQTAIETFAGNITPTQLDPSLVNSSALTLLDGIVASGGKRVENNAVAVWEFKTGSGNVAFDTSGVDPAIDLTISGDYNWVGGWGINIRSGKAQGSTANSKKLHDLMKATGEYSIEAWVVPANVTQEDARIISYSAGTAARNFTLGQTLYNYDVFNRSSTTDGNGIPALSTADAAEVLQASLQHVVVTYDPVNGRRLYVNGQFTGDVDGAGGGSLADWDDTFAFVLGNEVSGDRQFAGTFRMVAIHNRVLTDEQIVQNFDVGVGEKFFMLFSVGDLINVPDSYVLFEVTQFDDYAYLFTKPHFINLTGSTAYEGTPMSGIRIGINGAEAQVGQAYRNVDVTLSSTGLEELGQPLADIGTVIELQKGPDSDEFFLTFDVLGSNTNVRTDPVPAGPPAPVDGPPAPEIGIRTFDEIGATMAAVTGVSRTQTDVQATYATIRQQLPVNESIEGFSSAHQVAVAQLGIEYCNALIEDTSLRASIFPGFDFSASANAAFGSASARSLLLDPVIDRINGVNLITQPDASAIRGELDALITRLTACGASCPADRTETVSKSICAGALGSAVMLLQ